MLFKNKPILLLIPTLFGAFLPKLVFAQGGTGGSELNLLTLSATLVYGLLGIALCLMGYFVFDRLVGLNLRRELLEDQNIAVGIVLAGVFIGIAIVVAAVMLS